MNKPAQTVQSLILCLQTYSRNCKWYQLVRHTNWGSNVPTHKTGRKTTTPPASLKETLELGCASSVVVSAAGDASAEKQGTTMQSFFASQCQWHNNAVQFSFPLSILCPAQGACMAAQCQHAVTLRVGTTMLFFFCITMLQPGNNAVQFPFPFLSLFFLRHNGACMATQCWHPLQLHSNNAAICAA